MKNLNIIGTVLFLFGLQSCNKDNRNTIENKSEKTPTEIRKVDSPTISTKTNKKYKNVSDFVPEGYVIAKYDGGISAGAWDKIEGDLNKDGLDDVILIIKGTDKSRIIQHESRGNWTATAEASLYY